MDFIKIQSFCSHCKEDEVTNYKLGQHICNPHFNNGRVSRLCEELSKLSLEKEAETIHLGNEQKLCTDISPVKKYRWQISVSKMFSVVNR